MNGCQWKKIIGKASNLKDSFSFSFNLSKFKNEHKIKFYVQAVARTTTFDVRGPFAKAAEFKISKQTGANVVF